MRQSRVVLLAFVCLLSVAPAEDPVFPYGAVYFRKSNPPEEDWERDHKVAAKIGMNNFRHWLMWSAVEVAPDKYDWRDYDRMMDLAAKTGIRVTLAEMITAAPEWMFDKYAHARYKASDDSVINSQISGSSAIGGFPGLCLDNEDVRGRAERFLTAMVEHYKNHPAMWAWDLWNEHSFPGGGPPRMLCYCEAVVDGLDVVTVRVEYERGVVVAPVRPLARRSVLLPASREGCGVECVHLLDARRRERDVARHALRLAALDRERLVLVAAVSDAEPERRFSVIDESVTERRECGLVEHPAGFEVANGKLHVVDGHGADRSDRNHVRFICRKVVAEASYRGDKGR